jgi:hypothetical protein
MTENAVLTARLARPEPAESFVASLMLPPADFAARRAAVGVLELLEPGALSRPEPSRELLSRLAFLPTRARAAAKPATARPRSLASRFFGDWRVTVALVYGVLFLVIGVLRVDPLSVARGAASDLTSTGERVLGEARVAAVKRLEGNALTRRLDYKVYRAVTAGKARAAAYAQLVFEKVVGGGEDAVVANSPARARPPRRPSREPAGRILRSSIRTSSERVERT